MTTYFPYAVLAKEPFSATNDPSNNNIIVSTRFMEVMEPIRPIAPGTDFVPFLNESKRFDIYSVGTANVVYRMRPLEGTNADYSMEDLGITARSLCIFEGKNGLNNPDILGINNEGSLTLSQYNPTSKSYQQKVFQPVRADQKLRQVRATKLSGLVYVNVIQEDAIVGNSYFDEMGKWTSSTWVTTNQPDGKADAKALQINMCQNNPVQNALYAISEQKTVWFADSKNRFSTFQDLGYLNVRDISIIEDSENLLNIFAIGHVIDKENVSDKVWVKRQKKHPSTPGATEWEDWAIVSDAVVGKSIKTALDVSNLIKVFVMEDDAASSLFIIREMKDTRARRTGWTMAFPLGKPVPDAIFSIAQDDNGLAEAFSIMEAGPEGDVSIAYRFWQDPTTQNWQSEPILIERPTEAISLPAHSVDLAFVDGAGAALPLIRFSVSSMSPTTIRINGRVYPVGPLNKPVELEADCSGRATIVYLTNTLSSPELIFKLDGMNNDEAITIAPNAALQERLHVMQPEEILAAKDKNGKELLQGTPEEREYNAKSIADISQRSMSIGMPADKAQALKVPYLWKNKSPVGLRYHGRSRDQNPCLLKPSDIAEQHWRVRFEGSQVHCEDILATDAQTYLNGAAEFAANQNRLLSSSAGASVQGFFDFNLGDLWEAIKNGVNTIVNGLKEFVVTTIVDPIKKVVSALKVVFKFIIDGIEYLIDKTIVFLQQAFDLIEAVWNKIKVFFKELYEWLAFLFNLPDILRTQSAIEHSMNVSIDFAKIAIVGIRDQIAAGLDSLSENVKKSMDKFAAEVAGETLNEFMKKDQTPSAQEESGESGSHNVVGNAFTQNYQGATSEESNGLLAMMKSDPLNELMEILTALTANFEFGEGKEAFNKGLAYFEQIATSPDKMLNLALAGMVSIMESIVLTGIALAKGVILTIFDLMALLFDEVKKMANYRFEIPILSPIYKFFTGRELTFSILGVTSLIIAVPTTFGYKLATGSAPFPNDASLEVFKKEVSAEKMAIAAGFIPAKQLSSKAKSANKVKKASVKASKGLRKAMGWCLFGTFFIRGIVEPIQNALVAAKQVSQGVFGWLDKFGGLTSFATSVIGLATWVLRMLTSIFTAPWLTQADAGEPGCDTGAAFGQIVWICQLICGPTLGAIFWFATIFKGAKLGTVNIVRLILWGLVHLGMVIAQAIAGGFSSGVLMARAIIGCLAPQLFWFALYKPVIEATEGISVIAEMALSSVSMFANAVLTAVAVSEI